MKQRVLAYDPASPVVMVQIAISNWNQRQYDETITWARRALERDAKQPLAWEYLSSYWAKRDVESFVAMHLERADVFGGSILGPRRPAATPAPCNRLTGSYV